MWACISYFFSLGFVWVKWIFNKVTFKAKAVSKITKALTNFHASQICSWEHWTIILYGFGFWAIIFYSNHEGHHMLSALHHRLYYTYRKIKNDTLIFPQKYVVLKLLAITIYLSSSYEEPPVWRKRHQVKPVALSFKKKKKTELGWQS